MYFNRLNGYICNLQYNWERKHMDINVTGVWELGINGRGVTVAVVDDGKWVVMVSIGPSGAQIQNHNTMQIHTHK